jgi:formylmethanofuran:tetrahydromethanopterin formyltransferase
MSDAAINNIPGTLNITLKRSDDFSTVFDFSTSAVGVTATSEIVSMVTGATVATVTTTVVSATDGTIQITIPPSRSSSLALGTYQWRHLWDYPGDSQRTMLSGILEVV